ncbi:MAG: hypothetical protein AAFO94_23230, partial [Bacteroidota bacterium]
NLELEIDEFINYEQTGTFVGKIVANNQITGRWSSSVDSTRSYDFNLKERTNLTSRPEWEGVWHRNELYSPGTLVIGDSDQNGFYFALSITNNGHSGVIDGRTTYSDSLGIATYQSNEYIQDDPCRLAFRMQQSSIIVEQDGPSFSCGFGMRAYASGTYDDEVEEQRARIEYGTDESTFPTQNLHDRFREMVGSEAYEIIAFNMQVSDISETSI